MKTLSVKDVATVLGVQQHHVLSLIQNGSLRASDVSISQGQRPRWRITEDDLDGFLAKRTEQVTPPRRRRRKPAPTITEFF